MLPRLSFWSSSFLSPPSWMSLPSLVGKQNSTNSHDCIFTLSLFCELQTHTINDSQHCHLCIYWGQIAFIKQAHGKHTLLISKAYGSLTPASFTVFLAVQPLHHSAYCLLAGPPRVSFSCESTQSQPLIHPSMTSSSQTHQWLLIFIYNTNPSLTLVSKTWHDQLQAAFLIHLLPLSR